MHFLSEAQPQRLCVCSYQQVASSARTWNRYHVNPKHGSLFHSFRRLSHLHACARRLRCLRPSSLHRTIMAAHDWPSDADSFIVAASWSNICGSLLMFSCSRDARPLRAASSTLPLALRSSMNLICSSRNCWAAMSNWLLRSWRARSNKCFALIRSFAAEKATLSLSGISLVI